MSEASVIERFWSNVDMSDECWNWRGSLDHYGYGAFSIRKVMHKAHRYAYELLVGPIPMGLVIDHLCANRQCVNPEHLEPVTQAENVTRSNKRAAMARMSCRAGHPYTPENTRFTDKQRVCRVCRRERDNKAKAS